MICKKDVEDGKAFLVAAISSRVILPNGEEAEVLKDKAKHHYTKHDWQHVR